MYVHSCINYIIINSIEINKFLGMVAHRISDLLPQLVSQGTKAPGKQEVQVRFTCKRESEKKRDRRKFS